jgi:threonine dehydratase
MKCKKIELAAKTIDPVFLHSPQYQSQRLSQLLGFPLICKVESVNPIGCFKGRGADWWIKCHPQIKKLVCVSAGNFGLAMAYAGRKNNVEVHVFSIQNANPEKIQLIKQLGANIHLQGTNYDIVREEARKFSEKNDCYLIVDGKEIEITEGAGTIGLELSLYSTPIDQIFIPVGDGALINGIGSWFKSINPQTKLIGVCAKGAPAMHLSWTQGKIISTPVVNTIADGVAINTPIHEAFEQLKTIADEIVLVDDAQIIGAMKLLYDHEHLVTEPAGALSLAAAVQRPKNNKTTAVVISGANVDTRHREKWLQGLI